MPGPGSRLWAVRVSRVTDLNDTWPGHWAWFSHEGNWVDWEEPGVTWQVAILAVVSVVVLTAIFGNAMKPPRRRDVSEKDRSTR